MMKQAATSSAFYLSTRLAELILDCTSTGARKALRWAMHAPDTTTLIERLEELNSRAWSILLTQTRGTLASEEIVDVCTELLDFVRNSTH